MGLSRRLRNIAKSQLSALKDRLDRIDAEADEEARDRLARRDAEQELDDPTDLRPIRRSPEEIARGSARQPPISRTAEVSPSAIPPAASSAAASPLAVHYRILGLEDGADLSAVDAAYAKLADRCATNRFPEGSEEQKAAGEILKRVEAAYNALRDALDPTAGRFDKLEL